MRVFQSLVLFWDTLYWLLHKTCSCCWLHEIFVIWSRCFTMCHSHKVSRCLLCTVSQKSAYTSHCHCPHYVVYRTLTVLRLHCRPRLVWDLRTVLCIQGCNMAGCDHQMHTSQSNISQNVLQMCLFTRIEETPPELASLPQVIPNMSWCAWTLELKCNHCQEDVI